MYCRNMMLAIATVALTTMAGSVAQAPLGASFTYQGYLYDGGQAADGVFDMKFELRGGADGSVLIQSYPAIGTIAVDVDEGLFSVVLEFNAAHWAGDRRWLGIVVEGVALTPYQEILAAPHALFAMDTNSVRGRPYSAAAPASGQVLKWSGTDWAPAADANTQYAAGAGLGLVGLTFSLDLPYVDTRFVNEGQTDGVTQTMLVANAVTTTKIADGAVTDAKVLSVAWGKITGAPVSYPPSGAASGDLSGTYPGPTVARVQGSPVSPAAPAANQVLKWAGGAWTPSADSDTTYAAGTGLSLAGTTFSLNTSYTDSRYVEEGQAASGDLSATYPGPTVARLQGRSVSNTAPAANQVLKWNGAAWTPATDSDTTYTAGSGLQLSGNAFSVVAGDGIDVATNVAVDVTDIAGDGLGEDASNNLKVNVSTGLELSSDAVRMTTAYSSGSAYDSRFVNDNSAEVAAADIALPLGLSASATGPILQVDNTYSSNLYAYGIEGRAINTSNDWYHWGVYGIAGSTHPVWGGMRHAGVFGGGQSGYSYLHGVIGASYDGYGVWGASSNSYAGYFTGDVHIVGDLTATGSKAGWLVDVCYNADSVDLVAGDVVVLNGEATQDMMYGTIPVPRVKRCDKAADTRVVGVVVSRKKITPTRLDANVYRSFEEAAEAPQDNGAAPWRETPEEAAVDRSIVPPRWGCNVAILGAIEACKVDARQSPIAVGDLLTTSATPGHAMKASQPQLGTIVGKALEPCPSGARVIKITVTLR